MNQDLISKYDSEFCGKLPIHLINVIQPYGILLVITSADQQIVQASENTDVVFGVPVSMLVGKSILEFVPGIAELEESLPVPLRIREQEYLGIIHRKERYYFLEINLDSKEEVVQNPYLDLFAELRQAMSAIEKAKDIHAASEIAAKELKKASGFDKVMIYQFDTDWNGHVLAEEMESDMESYIDFTFPASDIPKQARELYLKNPYRFIPDRNYVPVKLFPVINPITHSFVDMSDCNVRGVSTVHIEYLKNMHVTASMSTRIIKDGQLWGLIACHHKTPKKVNFKMCAVFELLSDIISTKTAALENADNHQLTAYIKDVYSGIVGDIYRTRDVPGSLLGDRDNLLELFNSSGAIYFQNGTPVAKGRVPEQHDIEDLILWIDTRALDQVFCTESLSAIYEYAKEYQDIGSGLMVIPIDRTQGNYLLIFRQETVQTIKWGGDPESRISFEKDMKTYHPRFSFKLWQENLNGVSLPWKKDEIATAEKLRQFLQEFSVHDKTGKKNN